MTKPPFATEKMPWEPLCCCHSDCDGFEIPKPGPCYCAFASRISAAGISQAVDLLILNRGAEDLLALKAEVPTRVSLPANPL